jgi:parvulin-like peptidyl-prolyl isomerase
MRIDGVDITRAEYLFYIERLFHPTENNKEAADCVDDFVFFKLQAARARAAGTDTTTSFRSQVNNYRNHLVEKYLPATPPYSNNLSLRIKQLFIRLPQNISQQTLKAAKERIDSLYDELQRNPSKFDEYIEAYSDEKRTRRLQRLQMTAEMEEVAFKLPDHVLSPPFYTPLGLHIIQVTERGMSPEILEKVAAQYPLYSLSVQLYEDYWLASEDYRQSVAIPSADRQALAAYFEVHAGKYRKQVRRQNKENPRSYRDLYRQVLKEYQATLKQRRKEELRSHAKVEIIQEVLKTVN